MSDAIGSWGAPGTRVRGSAEVVCRVIASGVSLAVACGSAAGQACESTIVFEPNPVITGNGPRGIEIADIDLDGRLDILTANFDGSNASLVYQSASGGFAPPIQILGGLARCNNISAAQLDGDMFPDVVATTGDPGTTGQISLVLQSSAGMFSNQIAFFGYEDAFQGLVLGDFDGDGDQDAAVVSEFAQDDEMIVFWNNGMGLFFERSSYAVPVDVLGTSIAAADLNMDGALDIAVTDRGTNSVHVFTNMGGREFAVSSFPASAPGSGSATYPTRVVASDFNNDQVPDLIVSLRDAAGGTGAMMAYINNGAAMPSFTPSSFTAPLAVGVGADSFDWGDLTLDGVPDLAIVERNGGTPDRVLIYAGEGDGTFCEFASLDLDIATDPQECRIADIDGDGANDLLVSADSTDGDRPAGTDVVMIFESNPGSQDCNGNSIPDDQETFAELNWDDPTGGAFSAISSWCPRQQPGPGDDLAFDLDGVFDVTLDDDFTVEQAEFRRGSARLLADDGPTGPPVLTIGDARSSATGGRDGDLEIGVLPSVPASLEIAGGTVLVGPSPSVDTISIAAAPGTIGDVRVTGDGTLLRANASRLDIGTFGLGSLLVDGGGRVEAGEALLGLIPSQSGAGTGTLSVRDAGSLADFETTLVIRQGSLEVRDGGTLRALVVNIQDGSVTGNSTIDANISNRGVVNPGLDGMRGTLTVTGGYAQQGVAEGVVRTGQLRVDLAGEGDADRLVVGGTAQLSGGLNIVEAGDLGGLSNGASIPVLEADAVSGRFDVAFLPGIGGGRFLRVTYGEDGSVSLIVDTLGDDLGFGDESTVSISGVPRAARLADMNLDGLPDVVLALPDDADPTGAPGSVIVLYNGGLGGPGGETWQGFTASLQVLAGIDPSAIAIGNLDGAGGPDIVVVNRGDDNAQILLNDGSGEQGSITPFATFGFNDAPTAVAVGDLDEDGRVDVGVAGLAPGDPNAGLLTVRLNAGGVGGGWAGLSAGTSDFGVGVGVDTMDFGDFDNDSCIDVFLTSDGDGGVGLLDNLGNEFGQWLGFSLPRTIIQTGADPDAATLGDFNEDGFLDFVVTDGADDTLTIVLNEGSTGSFDFRPPTSFAVGSDPGSVASADLDGDGDSDLAFIVNNETDDARIVQVFRNDFDAANDQLQYSPAASIAPAIGNPLFVLAGDVDGLNGDDIVAVGQSVAPLPAPGAPNGRGGSGGGVSTTLNSGDLGGPGCTEADIAEPFGTLDLGDISAFVLGFGTQDPIADIAEPFGTFDLGDIAAFIASFNTGCP